MSRSSIDALVPIFEQLLTEAPIRDRSAGMKNVPDPRLPTGVSLGKPSDHV